MNAAARELARRIEGPDGELSALGERLAEDLNSGLWDPDEDYRVPVDAEPYPESRLY